MSDLKLAKLPDRTPVKITITVYPARLNAARVGVHRSALSADWAHVPIPKDHSMFEQATALGEQVARLLDAQRDAADIIAAILGEERASALAQIRRTDGAPIRPEDLKVSVNYWGGARGRWVPRPFMSDEDALAEWGERTGDLYIGDEVFFANVPEAVWRYELGGYPVLKKWLGYRQAGRRADQPLTAEERRWFRSVIQRIASLLALAPRLDALYSAASENAFTAQELEIER